VIEGYWDDGKIDRSAFDVEGYFHTGDLLERVASPEGASLYRFVGRSKEIIVRGGMKISPAELEEHLASHPQIREAACVGIADPVLGERVAAVVVPGAGESITLDSVVAFLRQRGLATYKLPERLFTAESLPRNPNNKVIRSELKRMLGIE
jgi:acyl-CoA synthetase (AMP-forming)/AMP-acid ligase II